jgi:hypothetical protein
MTVIVRKPNLNIREELSALKKPTGIFGEQIIRTQTADDLYNVIGTNRNLLINGDFRISQRGDYSGGVSASNDLYTVDRYRMAAAGMNSTFSHINATLPGGRIVKAMRIAATSSGSTAYIGFRSTIEEFWRLSDQFITISFWARTNNPYAGLRHDSTTDILPKLVPDSQWRKYAITYKCPTITAAGPNANQTTFALLTYNQTAAVQVNSGDFIEVAEWQIELGTVATPFEYRPIQQELALCQRYFERVDGFDSNSGFWSGNVTSGSTYFISIPYAVPKRSSASITINSTNATSAFGAVSASSSATSTNGFRINATANADGVGQYFRIQWSANSEY